MYLLYFSIHRFRWFHRCYPFIIGYAVNDVSFSSVSIQKASAVYAKIAAKPTAIKINALAAYVTPSVNVALTLSYAALAYKVAGSSYTVPYAKAVVAEKYGPAHYDFRHGVNDAENGDYKIQEEHREGDVVKGSYFLIETDDSKGIVEYTF